MLIRFDAKDGAEGDARQRELADKAGSGRLSAREQAELDTLRSREESRARGRDIGRVVAMRELVAEGLS